MNSDSFDSVSVIIPVYNSERTIIRALDSVRGQTARNFITEILIVNDGSNDGTVRLIEDYHKQNSDIPIRLINQENRGVSCARNRGIQEASGKWIALLDSDDEWFPDKLEKQFKIIQARSDIDFIGGNWTADTVRILWRKIDKLYQPTIKDLCIKMFPQTSTVLFKRAIFDEIGGYDETRRYAEDQQYFLRICEKYNYFYMPEQLISYDGKKRGFGASGLSANLREMQKGAMQNLRELYERKAIGPVFYAWVYVFDLMKYFRRIIICKLGGK